MKKTFLQLREQAKWKVKLRTFVQHSNKKKKHHRKHKRQPDNNDFYFLRGLKFLPNGKFKGNTVKEKYLNYCRSQYFKRLKAEVLRLNNNKCAYCPNKAQTAHHLRYGSFWTKTRISDCVPVCHTCHENLHPEVRIVKKLIQEVLYPNFYDEYYVGL